MIREAHIGSLIRAAVIALLLVVLVGVRSPERTEAGGQTFVVNVAENAVDLPDGTCDTTSCTLTDAMNAANASPGHDTILFDQVEFDPQNADQIITIDPLPMVLADDGITIDGSGRLVEIVGFEQQVASEGLFFHSTSGADLRDVTIRSIGVAFFQAGIKFCPGAATRDDDCYGDDAINVLLDGITMQEIERRGIQVDGESLSDIEVTNSTLTTVGSSIDMYSPSGVDGVTITGNDIVADDGYGFIITGGVNTTTADVARNIDVSDNTFENGPPYIYRSGGVSGVLVQNNDVALSFGDGITVVSTGSRLRDASVLENTVHLSSGDGIHVRSGGIQGAGVDSATIAHNTVTKSQRAGIHVEGTALGPNLVLENTVQSNVEDGIMIADHNSVPNGARVTISRNHTFSNGHSGIDLVVEGEPSPGVTENDAGDGDGGPNELLNFPVLGGSDGVAVTGTACSDCKIELFEAWEDDSGHGEGETFLAEVMSGGDGLFSVPICDLGLDLGTFVTATATDEDGNTSEFSLNLALSEGSAPCPSETPTPTASLVLTPTPAPTESVSATPAPTPSTSVAPGGIWGDSDCSGNIGARDNQALLRHVLSQSPLSQTEPCPDIGATVGGRVWGDWDCNGAIGARDNQALLRFVLDQTPLSQTEPCPDIGLVS